MIKKRVVSHINKVNDWDLEEMEYIWYTILKRVDDFYNITPKFCFEHSFFNYSYYSNFLLLYYFLLIMTQLYLLSS